MTRMFWFFMMGNESGVGFCMKTDLIFFLSFFFQVSYFNSYGSLITFLFVWIVVVRM